MGTPEPKDFEAALYDFAGTTVAQLVRESVPADQKILDVGAGWGKFALLLPEYDMEAVEVFPPNVEKNNLCKLYSMVYIYNIVNFKYRERYGAVIMGDVLEHLSVEDAQKVLRLACENADHVFVVVPFEMPQDEEDGNCHEIHIQDDLTEALMAERYPELKLFDLQFKEDDCGGTRLVARGHTKAVYIKA